MIRNTTFNSNNSYLIIGGLGGFGLQLIQWMVNKGVKRIVINSRTGIVSQYQRMIVNTIRVSGVICVIDKHSLTDTNIEHTLNLVNSIATISGIFNLAMITSDALFINQSIDTFSSVCKPKLSVTHNLDVMTRRQCNSLQYFVTFSSIVSGRGNAGQTNYGFANSAMERICEKRRKDGLHGLAIQWGAIGDVGIVAENMGGNDVVIADTIPQRIHSCLQILDQMLQSSQSVVCSHVKAHRKRQIEVTSKTDLLSKVCNALGIRDKTKLKSSTSLGELGIDSLMVAQIKQLLEQECSKNYSNDIRKITINDLK